MSRKNQRKKYINRNKPTDAQRMARGRKALVIGIIVVLLLVGTVVFLMLRAGQDKSEMVQLFEAKAELLKAEVLSDARDSELGEFSVEDMPESVVFISVSSGAERAMVFTGCGDTREKAWDAANSKAIDYINEKSLDPKWVKADLVSSAKSYNTSEFSTELHHFRHEFFRQGIAFDKGFDTALLEAELNAAKILDYDNEYVNLEYLNSYLGKAGRQKLEKLPEDFILFNCLGFMCDENSEVYKLSSEGYDYGRRSIELIDKDYAAQLVKNASGFLMDQVREDGSFVYGIYPRFDNNIDNYNIVRHASTLWSLVCQYRMTGNPELAKTIEKAIDYMISTAVIYDKKGNAYLCEEKSGEIKLGGCGVAVIALSEYMDAFESDKYLELAKKLGGGILTMLDQKTGEYYHVLNKDLSQKEAFRTVYYDGEATFALCKLYSLTQDELWLDAAKSAVEHFIDADYVQYKDHWVSYSMNEITKYVDNVRYYEFALRNAQENLKTIYERDTTYHTYFELLMSCFELYDRMVQNDIHVDYDFKLKPFLKTIYARADHMLNGYFFPEYAMYMANPDRILDTFMVRHDGYRIRIDDVQHSVGGYYLYYMNYDKLVEYGMLDCRE